MKGMRNGLPWTLALIVSVAPSACSESSRTPSPHAASDAATPSDAGTAADVAADGAAWVPVTRPDAAARAPLDAGGSTASNSTDADRPGPMPAEPDHHEDAGHASDDAGADTDAAARGGVCSACGRCEEVFPVTSRVHTTAPVQYLDPPPTNGAHNPCWARWGVHATEVLDDRWVHNLEHGGVVFLYNCPQGCADDIAALERFASAQRRTLVSPYAALPTRFGVVAWSHRLLTDCVDEAAFAAFYDANFDHGVESTDAQPDASCPP